MGYQGGYPPGKGGGARDKAHKLRRVHAVDSPGEHVHRQHRVTPGFPLGLVRDCLQRR